MQPISPPPDVKQPTLIPPCAQTLISDTRLKTHIVFIVKRQPAPGSPEFNHPS